MKRLQQIFSDNWSVRQHDFNNMMSLLMPAVIAGNLAGATAQLDTSGFMASATGLPYMARWWELDDMSLPDDSVCVIRLTGMLYAWDSDKVAETMAAVESNPRICGAVFVIDGPGGMVSRLDGAVRAVLDCSKPVATVVTGCMASAHFWLGTCADHTFATSPLCEVGSVGVVLTHYGLRRYFEMNGIDYREIYPDTADLKNRASRDVDEGGEESLYKARAERIHRVFSEQVAENLGIAYDPRLPLFRGELFAADEAVKAGYIDEFGDLADAVAWVLARAAVARAAGYDE